MSTYFCVRTTHGVTDAQVKPTSRGQRRSAEWPTVVLLWVMFCSCCLNATLLFITVFSAEDNCGHFCLLKLIHRLSNVCFFLWLNVGNWREKKTCKATTREHFKIENDLYLNHELLLTFQGRGSQFLLICTVSNV